MGYVSSEEGMRFTRLWCGTKSAYHRAGAGKSVLIKLRWLTDDEKSIIAYWDFYGQTAEIAEAKCDQKLHDISLVCEGYTLHKYFLLDGSSGKISSDTWKYAGTSCCSICRPEKEGADNG
tara:strand:- start:704 stop:1063 length:360 start_codon:yes stop_codon:yes gene_type:complete